jgi:two-component system chemotaxis response regulator CheB
MQLCGLGADGAACLAAVLRLRPDVVVLDLEMPVMNGLDVLERLRVEEPGLPVIMCSSHTERGARSTLDVLALGAADYVMKPAGQQDFASAIEALALQLLPKIAALAGTGHLMLSAMRGETVRGETTPQDTSQELAFDVLQPIRYPALWLGPAAHVSPPAAHPVEVVVIGVSTGGPSALEAMLPGLAASFPVPILIVQHMPKLFTGALAERLDRCCNLRVREAFDAAELHPGTIWLAPGDSHMEVAVSAHASASAIRAGNPRRAVVRLHQQRSLNHCKPSVDYLFHSAARIYGASTLALVMTGMGSDGLTGARSIHQAGGAVLAQDRATSAVWGMPGRVVEAGLSREPLPLHALAGELTRRVESARSQCSAPGLQSAATQPQRRTAAAAHSARPNHEVTYGLL